ncbi:hypothetical protein GBA52_026360 [Prunus armeniaca]|nr:hypothetical protein GBA52_026360 [Prunus armeniaca]
MEATVIRMLLTLMIMVVILTQRQVHENTNFDPITAAALDQSAENGCKIEVRENKKTTTRTTSMVVLKQRRHVIRGRERVGA